MREQPQEDEEAVPLKQLEVALAAERERRRIFGLPAAVVAGACYCMASMSMVLLNKVALSSFAFQSATALLFFQCALAVALVQACKAAGLVQVEELRWGIVRICLPVNLVFVAMIATSFWALQNLNVAMITVLKNLTNLFTLGGDYAVYGRTYKPNIVNCLLTAAYMLAMRGAMDRVAQHTSDGQKLGEFSMVATGEAQTVWSEPALRNPTFLSVAGLSGLIGFAISFTSLWFLSTTTPSIFSLVGSLNKVPLALLGLFAFNVPWTLPNLLSVLVGTAAGVVFAVAKNKS